jgi:hypothetical protein
MQDVADARVLDYDTLVLEKNTDYDTKGTLTDEFAGGRGKVWTERALRAGSEATARRDRGGDEIADREKLVNALQRRNEREEQERIARFEEFQRRQAGIGPANQGGIDLLQCGGNVFRKRGATALSKEREGIALW